MTIAARPDKDPGRCVSPVHGASFRDNSVVYPKPFLILQAPIRMKPSKSLKLNLKSPLKEPCSVRLVKVPIPH